MAAGSGLEPLFSMWMAKNPDVASMVEFHTRHKLLLMAHDVPAYRELGKLVAHGKELPFDELKARYIAGLMAGLKKKATPARNANVLMHMLGHFKKRLSTDEKQEMLELVADYKAGMVPLIVPVTLINHFVRKYDEPYLKQQYYLRPHPLHLQIRSQV